MKPADTLLDVAPWLCWAAGSVFLMLQAALGVTIDALKRTITIDAPVLPAGVERLSIGRLQVGEARVDLDFHRLGDQVVVTPRNRTGEVRIVTKPAFALSPRFW